MAMRHRTFVDVQKGIPTIHTHTGMCGSISLEGSEANGMECNKP